MTLNSYQILALINVNPNTKFGYSPTHGISDINKNIRLLLTNQRTKQQTNQSTDGSTNKTIHRDASQSLDASKNSNIICLASGV